MMKLIGYSYGGICYLLGIASLVGFILFANNFMGLLGMVQYNIDSRASMGIQAAVAINLLLIGLFGIQHSVMARPAFKQLLTRLVPTHLERSTYVLGTALVIGMIIHFWQGISPMLWRVEDPLWRQVITVIYFLGWTITLLATFMLNHFHLFGLQQSFRPSSPDAGSKEFKTPMFYRFVRHPIQTGVVIGMLATPDMSVGRALLAVGLFVYIGVGLYFEERDLVTEFGDTYRDYRKRVPPLFPAMGSRSK
ncbi:MAG: protein-S-isoprenylcysteine O-methyltransferase Ste14 [Glaciecola sp.]|jgi:protein-S-isoprenylcysteine O-methyltransferase Ste14|uniref:methyltransferase family protein n=1 Tax=Congregibacter sp. TaxID=2744308 RepID=UPI0039E68AE2